MPGMPLGFKYPPSGRLARYLKHRGSDASWGSLLGLPGVSGARHPEQRTGVKQEGFGTHGSPSPRARLSQGRNHLPPAPQASIISKKQPGVKGRAGTPGMAGWEAAQAGTASGTLGLGRWTGQSLPESFQCFAEGSSLHTKEGSCRGEGSVLNPALAGRAAGCRSIHPPSLHPDLDTPTPAALHRHPRGLLPALTQAQGDVDGVGVLDAKGHGLALPPGALLLAVEVGEERGVVVAPGVAGVAAVAQGAGVLGPHVQAIILRGRPARVGGLDGPAEGGVLEDGHAAAGLPPRVPAGG